MTRRQARHCPAQSGGSAHDPGPEIPAEIGDLARRTIRRRLSAKTPGIDMAETGRREECERDTGPADCWGDRRARFFVSVVFPDFELWLGEAESLNRRDTSSLKVLPALRFKFSQDIGPNPSGFAGREFVFPLQSLAKLSDEYEGEHASEDGVGVIVCHDSAPTVEITPEMIERGVKEFCECRGHFAAEPDLTVVLVFRAMIEASKQFQGWEVTDCYGET
jgi:hypothetical protein